jgi:signal transduction histidine kinase
MRERVALVDGTVAVESSPGVGTTVYVRLPLLERATDGAPGDAATGAAWRAGAGGDGA